MKMIEIWIQVLLICVASVSYGFTIFSNPLVDYDEASYAKVITHTIASGDVTTFSVNGSNWFEKPPLYLWLGTASVKIFGAHEFAFRLPSVLLSILCLWLVFLIARQITQRVEVGAVAFLILLYSPSFFVFAREARLDSGVIMAILTGLFFWIKAWENKKFLVWLLPTIAVGFLFKSVIAFLIFPILFFYSLFYKQWSWILSKYLWLGLILALAIVLPWHIAETLRFGQAFWDDYLFRQVFHRGMSTMTGTNNYYDYIRILWLFYQPWLCVAVVSIPLLFGTIYYKASDFRIEWRHLLAPLVSALFIIIAFTLARTHLSTYIMPAYPLLAIFIAIALNYCAQVLKEDDDLINYILIPVLLLIGCYSSFSALGKVVTDVHFQEREIGQAIAKNNYGNDRIPLYALDWHMLDTVKYYGNTSATTLNAKEVGGTVLKGPVLVMTHTLAQNFFFVDIGKPRAGFEELKVLFQGGYLVLLYSEKDIKLPVF